eukprot:13681904-Ditylum_brightwellii.AAC.2
MPTVQSPQSPAKAPTTPEIPYVTNDKFSDDDELVNSKDQNNYKVDTPLPPRYNICMHVNDSINFIIFKETLNVQQTTNDLVHQGRYSIATKIMQIKERYKSDMYLSVGRFARVLVDDETGKHWSTKI